MMAKSTETRTGNGNSNGSGSGHGNKGSSGHNDPNESLQLHPPLEAAVAASLQHRQVRRHRRSISQLMASMGNVCYKNTKVMRRVFLTHEYGLNGVINR